MHAMHRNHFAGQSALKLAMITGRKLFMIALPLYLSRCTLILTMRGFELQVFCA